MSKFNRIIYETENFIVDVGGWIYVSREDGGHLKIKMKNPVSDRSELTPKQAIEYMRLSMLIGKALEAAMNIRGIPVVRINYQDMGTWAWKETQVAPKVHMHIFGRSRDAKKQIFPESVQLPPWESGFYEGNERLNNDDIAELLNQIEIESKKEKYDPKNWALE